MIQTGKLRMHYGDIPDKILEYFGDRITDRHELDYWNYDLRAQTLLHRDASGFYEFAHKSLAEYFAAYKLAAECGSLGKEFRAAYLETKSAEYNLPFLSSSFDITKLVLPGVNSEISGFFGDMSADILSQELPSMTGSDPLALRFVDVAGQLATMFHLNERAPDRILPLAIESMRRNLKADNAWFSWRFGDEIVNQMPGRGIVKYSMNAAASLTTDVVKTGRTYRTSDLVRSNSVFYPRMRFEAGRIGAILLAPIKIGVCTIGAITFDSISDNAFTSENENVLTSSGFLELLGIYVSLVGGFKEPWEIAQQNQRLCLTISFQSDVKAAVDELLRDV
jgi:hypothetical protein